MTIMKGMSKTNNTVLGNDGARKWEVLEPVCIAGKVRLVLHSRKASYAAAQALAAKLGGKVRAA
jgi:hypothetical protein